MMQFTLRDPDGGSVNGTVVLDSYSLVIKIDGYGDFGSADGYGEPIYLEHYDGKLVLRVWADINQEDPTHTIDLSGALEAAREVEDAPSRP